MPRTNYYVAKLKKQGRPKAKRPKAKGSFSECRYCYTMVDNRGIAQHERGCSENPKNKKRSNASGKAKPKGRKVVKRAKQHRIRKENPNYAIDIQKAYLTGKLEQVIRGYAESQGVPFGPLAEGVAAGLHTIASRELVGSED